MSRLLTIMLVAALVLGLSAAVMAGGIIPPPSSMPRVGGCSVWANGQVYWLLGRSALTVTDAEGKTYGCDTGTAGVSRYSPTTGLWESSKYDGTGPLGMDQDGNGICDWLPGGGQYIGDWTQSNHAVTYDDDGDGVQEIFVAIGFYHNKIWKYDPNASARGTWSVVATSSEWGAGAGFRRGAVGIYGSKIFMASGGGADVTGKFGSYDISTGVWTNYANGPNSQQCGSTVVNGKFYVVGGTANSGLNIYECDLTQDPPVWSNGGNAVATLQVGVVFPAVVSYNGKVYVIGGRKSDGSASDVIQEFDPTTAQVTIKATFPSGCSGRWGLGAAVDPNTGVLYFGGGGVGGDAYRPNTLLTDWWSVDLDDLALTFNQIQDDPAYFPYEDWKSEYVTVYGTVSVGGQPYAGAYVGVKPASLGGYALADAKYYVVTDSFGQFSVNCLPGDYIIAAWPHVDTPYSAFQEKYAMSDNIAVSLANDKEVNIDIGDSLSVNFAKTNDASLVLGSEGVPDLPWGWLQAFNGARYGGDYWIAYTLPSWIQRDFGADPNAWPAIDTIVIGCGKEASGWSVDYTIETSNDGVAWATQYAYTGGNGGITPPNAGWDIVNMIKLQSPVTARYWRLTATKWGGTQWWRFGEFELYKTVKGLPGRVQGIVTLNGKPCANAVVGVKSSQCATADADAVVNPSEPSGNTTYFLTDVFGQFGPSEVIAPGTYYVGAWVDGFLPVEKQVVVDGATNPVVTVELNISTYTGKNVSFRKPVFWGPSTDPYSHAGRIRDGGRYGGDAAMAVDAAWSNRTVVIDSTHLQDEWRMPGGNWFGMDIPWEPNVWAGYTLKIKHQGSSDFDHFYTIAGNTSDTIEIAGGDLIADGVTNGDYYEIVSTTGDHPVYMGVDLGENIAVDQVVVDFFIWNVPYDYAIMYATDDGTGVMPPVGSSAWKTYYSTGSTKAFRFPFQGDSGPWEAIRTGTATGRWWMIYVTKSSHSWTPGMCFGVREFEVYSRAAQTSPAKNTCGEAKQLPDGTPVYLGGKVITGFRNPIPSGSMYIEDMDRTSGIRVLTWWDPGWFTPPDPVGWNGNFMGTMTTLPNGERALQLGDWLQLGKMPVPSPLGLNGSALWSPIANGLVVKVWGTIKYVDWMEPWFIVSDGAIPAPDTMYGGIKVWYDLTNVNPPVEGSFQAFDGILGMGDSGEPVIYLTNPTW